MPSVALSHLTSECREPSQRSPCIATIQQDSPSNELRAAHAVVAWPAGSAPALALSCCRAPQISSAHAAPQCTRRPLANQHAAMRSVIEANPEYEYLLFDDDDCRRFICDLTAEPVQRVRELRRPTLIMNLSLNSTPRADPQAAVKHPSRLALILITTCADMLMRLRANGGGMSVAVGAVTTLCLDRAGRDAASSRLRAVGWLVGITIQTNMSRARWHFYLDAGVRGHGPRRGEGRHLAPRRRVALRRRVRRLGRRRAAPLPRGVCRLSSPPPIPHLALAERSYRYMTLTSGRWLITGTQT